MDAPASITGSWLMTTSPTPSCCGRKQQPTSQDLEDDAVMGLVVAAGMSSGAAARPVVRLSKMARKSVGEEPTAQNDERCCGRAGRVPFTYAGARQPQDLSGARRQEWASFLKAVKKVAAAEDATVQRTLRTLRELTQYQVVRGRSGGLGDVDAIDLYSFLTEGTRAPARALAGLRRKAVWHCLGPQRPGPCADCWEGGTFPSGSGGAQHGRGVGASQCPAL